LIVQPPENAVGSTCTPNPVRPEIGRTKAARLKAHFFGGHKGHVGMEFAERGSRSLNRLGVELEKSQLGLVN